MNLANRDMSYMRKYQFENPKKYLSKGVKVPRFRKTKKQIRNRALYAAMLSKDIKGSELASKIGVTSRTVNAWITDGAVPKDENIDKVCNILGYPQHILFNEKVLHESPIICLPKESKYYKRVTAVSEAKNNILHGLLIVHNISLSDFAEWVNLAPATIRKYIHSRFLPDVKAQKIISDFFKVPTNVLFYDAIRD